MPTTIIGLIFLPPFIWAVARYIEYLFLHGRYGGRLKRGIRVWSEPLPEDVRHYLQRLPDDIVDSETGAFIRKEQNAVLIQPSNVKRSRRNWWLRGGVSIYYIGYIDLRVKDPRIQYRAPFFSFTLSLTMLTGWLVVASTGTLAGEVSLGNILGLSFAALIFGFIGYIFHIAKRDSVLRFIKKKMHSSW